MALLRLLTLAYAGVLVLALATALLAILYYLWRIARTLGDVQTALALVRDRTAPLVVHLTPLESFARAETEAFEEAAARLDEARHQLVDRLTPAESTT